MDEETRQQILRECRLKCCCKDYRDTVGSKRRNSSSSDQSYEYNQDQRSFISFVTEIISVIAFIVFGSIVFWLAVVGILFDCMKRLYHSDRCVKLFVAGLFTLLFLSMSIRLFLNKRDCRAQQLPEKGTKTKDVAVAPEPPKPLPEYMRITTQDKKLRNSITGSNNPQENNKIIKKTFTLSIVDEKKKEVFRTSKHFFISELAMEMKKPPALLVYLNEIVLDNY